MNSKKGKSKNRPKPSKIPQNVQDTVKVEPSNNVQEAEEKCENPIKEEIEVPQQVIETVTVVEEQVASEASQGAPKKPKRSKAKKKQDSWVEPAAGDEKLDKMTIKDDQKENMIENETETADIVPVARKKKNKSKKNVDQPKVTVEPQILDCENKTIEEDTIQMNLPETKVTETFKTSEVLQKDSLAPKKKKKKKHRHDSEKSDNDPCTLAFQKLLEASDDVNEKNENAEVSLDNIIMTEEIVTPLLVTEIPVSQSNQSENLKENVKEEGPKSKKKNKKGKKQPLETDTKTNKDIKTEQAEDAKNVTQDENITTGNVELETENVELSSKPKAKIIKPVQKKRKMKSESQETNNPVPAEIVSDIKHDESTKDIPDKPKMCMDIDTEDNKLKESVLKIESSTNIAIDLNSDLKENKTATVISDTIDDNSVISEPIKEFIPLEALNKKEQENVTSKCDLPEIKESQQEKDQIVTDIDKELDNFGFVEVKAPKHKKKRQNIEPAPEIIQSVAAATSINTEKIEPEKEIKPDTDQKQTCFNISQVGFEENSFKPEEFEALSIATPDLIQYPRSTSQQHLDDNNNTLIQEITTPDEVKLGIPIYTATPIIQGSGESPEAKTFDETIKIKVTEIDSTPNNANSDKNDIKSRIFEVNKDMEELRRSIERSLAELTGAEKCDSEVDKEFEELFQNQIKESQSSAPEEKSETFQKEKPISPQQSEHKTIEVKECVDSKKSMTEMIPKVEDVNIKEIEGENKSDKIPLNDQLISTEDSSQKPDETSDVKSPIPICPARSKGKSKSKKKSKKEPVTTGSSSSTTQQTDTTNKDSSKTSKSTSEKSEQKPQSSKEKGKQQSTGPSEDNDVNSKQLKLNLSFEPIENFEDALTSSVDDVNKTFEIIANEAAESLRQNNPQINIIAPTDDTEEKNKETKQKQNPASQPKNLLGKPNIPALSNKNDFKKEKNKPPNSIQAKVKIKDSVEIEKTNKQSKESQTAKKLIKESNGLNTYSYLSNTNEDFVYKYSFRKVFLQSSCHVCKKELTQRFPCKFCALVFYCSQKHLDEDWARHQSLCFAVSTIAHLKEQKHIYADAQNITGHEYRVLRMQMILSCEKILKRKLEPWEQEALLYPRLCADTSCRQWKQRMLKDCEGCGQISYCIEHPDHLPLSHQRWCKSYALYQKLVNYQQTKGRLEPRLPTKVLERYKIPEKMNDVLGTMYDEKIDMDDTQYAALTQLASAPLTAAYGYQLFNTKMNSTCANGVSKKSTFTIHAVGTDLQFEADSLNKWEIFFLHLRPDVQDLRVVLIGPELNPSKLPLDLLGKINLCENCRASKRRVIFHFHDKETYCDYYSGDDFITPDIVCAFNPNIHRSSMYNIKDTWPETINSVLKQKIPLIITSYTIEELERDMSRVKESSRYNYNVISEPKHNPFCSMRPDRNFITDHEIPLLFKNYCYTILCGAF